MAGGTIAPAQAGTQVVWAGWNTTYCTTMSTTTSASTYAADIVWANWASAGTGATVLTTSTSTCPTFVASQWLGWNTAYEETREQREVRERQQAEYAQRAAERAREREAAKERALELLSYCLTGEQLASYRERGWFEVTGSKGNRWRIRARGQAGNVDLMPEIGEEREATYCAHPPEGLPDADAHLAQALTLMTDEDAFLRVANRQYRRPAA